MPGASGKPLGTRQPAPALNPGELSLDARMVGAPRAENASDGSSAASAEPQHWPSGEPTPAVGAGGTAELALFRNLHSRAPHASDPGFGPVPAEIWRLPPT